MSKATITIILYRGADISTDQWKLLSRWTALLSWRRTEAKKSSNLRSKVKVYKLTYLESRTIISNFFFHDLLGTLQYYYDNNDIVNNNNDEFNNNNNVSFLSMEAQIEFSGFTTWTILERIFVSTRRCFRPCFLDLISTIFSPSAGGFGTTKFCLFYSKRVERILSPFWQTRENSHLTLSIVYTKWIKFIGCFTNQRILIG